MTTDTDWRTDDSEQLCRALLSLRNLDEAAAFLRDLCTRKEIADLSHRLTVARLLDEDLPYREIASRTGASTATITRINQWLVHGTGGYRLVLERLRRSKR